VSAARTRRPYGLYAYAAVFLGFLYGPLLVLALFSVNDSTEISLPIRHLTLKWYRELGQDPDLLAAFAHSVAVAASVAFLATALGVSSAWAIVRGRLRGARIVVGFMMLPLIVPGLILGVSLLVLLGRLHIELSLATIALGHLVLCVPFSLAVMLSAFEGCDRHLEEASRDLGEGPVATFLRVILPMTLPAIVASLLMTFIVSFDEFVLTFFLSGTRVTLPIYLWAQVRFPEKLPMMLALATLILGCSFALVALAQHLRRFGRAEEAVL
jgi:spermidine/putrescine transport system permease protein